MWEITPEKSASGYECTRSCWYGLSGMSLDENRVSRSVDGLAIYHQMSLAPRSTTEPTAPQPRASSRIQAHLSGPAGVRLVNRLICDRAGWQAGADSDYVRHGLFATAVFVVHGQIAASSFHVYTLQHAYTVACGSIRDAHLSLLLPYLCGRTRIFSLRRSACDLWGAPAFGIGISD